MIKALIVDDEPIARQGVKLRLKDEADVDIVGEACDGYDAVEKIQDLDPDLVFLDIQMPGLDGFGVLDALEGTPLPVVVFVTAFDEYALRAFRVHAVDYLVKPLTPTEFTEALDRARRRLTVAPAGSVSEHLQQLLEDYRRGNFGDSGQPKRYLQRLLIRDTEKIHFIRVQEVDWIESADNYVRVVTNGRRHLIRGTMSELESSLDPASFMRIHRGRIVNLERVREIRIDYRGYYIVVLKDGTEHKLSRGYRDSLLARGF